MVKVTRGFEVMGDRYEYDARCTVAKGWAQLDSSQDASYYGTWANPLTRKLLSYCEGDITITDCDDESEFVAELTKWIQWCKDAGYFLGIDALEPAKAEFVRLGFGADLH